MHESVRTVAWLTAYVGACLLGRFTVIQPENIGLVWPAAGVAMVWLASSTRRTWCLDIVLLSVSTFVVLLLTEGGVTRSILSLVTVFQAVVTVLALRRFVPGIWGTGGRVPLKRLRDLGFLLAVVITTALLTAVLRTLLGIALVPGEGWDLLPGRWGRNASAMATIGTFGLILGGWIAVHRDRGKPVLARPDRSDVLNGVGIVVMVLVVGVFGFWRDPAVPPTFILTLTSVWAGVRFNALVASAQSLLTGALVVWLTILGYGPIGRVDDPETRALTAQVFVIVLMVTSLTIAFSRRQTAETIGSLERSEATLAVRADELDMVMSRLQDGIAIIEAGGRVVHANDASAHRVRHPSRGAPRTCPGPGGSQGPGVPPGRAAARGGAERLRPGHGRRGRRRRGDPPHRRVRRRPGAGGLGVPGAARRGCPHRAMIDHPRRHHGQHPP